MVRITIDLIRKRSEHNEGEISTLEEITLHQENIERIELLNQMCRNLKILLMQNNIIGKIENLNMLKKLEYLNLALNNIEIIENLEGLESLKKLDLTVNFIGDLRSVKCLRRNENLETLYLTGNPCTDYTGYREYVVATLPQLRELDMLEITRSERILALQKYPFVEGDIIRAYRDYAKLRKSQIDFHRQKEGAKITELDEEGLERSSEQSESTDEEENEKFWKEKTYHSPEERIAIAERARKRQEKSARREMKKEKKGKKIAPKLFNPEGRPYNLNRAKVSFILDHENDAKNVILDIAVYRFLDSSHVDVDVHPDYVRVVIKGKILQLCLPCEVSVEDSFAQRNVTTGHLVITMPRLEPLPRVIGKTSNISVSKIRDNDKNAEKWQNSPPRTNTRRELLEIGTGRSKHEDLDFSRIYKDRDTLLKERSKKKEKIVPEDFIDDPEVPPLE